MKKSNTIISQLYFSLKNWDKLSEDEKNEKVLTCNLIKTILSSFG